MQTQPSYVFVYAAQPNVGGWVSFIQQATKAMLGAGRNFAVARIALRPSKPRKAKNGILFHYYTVEQLVKLAQAGVRVVIGVADKHGAERVDWLLTAFQEAGLPAPVGFVHDSMETTQADAIWRRCRRVVAQRALIVDAFEAAGMPTTQIAYPYTRKFARGTTTSGHMGRMGAISRVDFDKHTEEVVQANLMVPQDKQAIIYGAENRIFAHHKLTTTDPDWRRNYHGRFPQGTGAELAHTLTGAIDLSGINKDGGGVQFTFMEAWDAGCPLVLSERWFVNGVDHPSELGSALMPERNCIAVKDPDDLAKVLLGERATVAPPADSLDPHDPTLFVQRVDAATA